MDQVTAESVGFSTERLGRIRAAIQARIDSKKIPGAVIAVGRRGAPVLFEAFGYRDSETQAEMTTDSIFRIFGLTKPVVALGAMMLVEEGRLSLAAPVSEYLPALKGLKVGVETEGGELELVPPHREPTILDLLRHTSGFIYSIGTSAVRKLYRAANLDAAADGVDYIARLAKVPLQFQPGTRWAYGSSYDVLGHSIEAITGEALCDFIAARVTGPLGMRDTAWWMQNPADWPRLAESLLDPATGKRILGGDKRQRPARFNPGGGMVSTAADFVRFSRFFLNGGELDGVRLVSRKTVELMTTDHLPPHTAVDPDLASWLGASTWVEANGMGSGLGLVVRTHAGRAPWHGSVGDVSSFGLGPMFWVDPREELYGVVMAQTSFVQAGPLSVLIRSLIYQAIAD